MKSSAVIPYLWFDSEAIEAVEFYGSVFPDSSYISRKVIKDTPSGDCDEISFTIDGQMFLALNCGSQVSKNPSVSFILNYDQVRFGDARAFLKESWEKLCDGGKILVPLGQYGFSELFGWVEDKYGVSWQLVFTEEEEEGDPRPFVTPSLLFCEEVFGQAEEARKFYSNVFTESELGYMVKYQEGLSEVDKEIGKVMYSDLWISDKWLAMNDSGLNHGFTFNEGISFILLCDSQDEIDYYWSKLSHYPEKQQCGWCKDQFGVCWQIIPWDYYELMEWGNKEQVVAMTKARLKMTKFDLADLREAFENKQSARSVIEIEVNEKLEIVWDLWTEAVHIKNWYFASDDWFVTKAKDDVRVDGELLIGMSAKDGSKAFDYAGVYNKVDKYKTLIYTLGDQRKVIVEFKEIENGVLIRETYDNDQAVDQDIENSGWKAILKQFKKYVEAI